MLVDVTVGVAVCVFVGVDVGVEVGLAVDVAVGIHVAVRMGVDERVCVGAGGWLELQAVNDRLAATITIQSAIVWRIISPTGISHQSLGKPQLLSKVEYTQNLPNASAKPTQNTRRARNNRQFFSPSSFLPLTILLVKKTIMV